MRASPTFTRFVAVAIFLCAMPMLAQTSLDDAVNRLSSVKVFAFGGTGFAGVISKGETDYKFVLAQPPAIALAAFEQLYLRGNPQGKAYALTGIRKLDPARFRNLISSINGSANGSAEKVETMHGCIISAKYLNEIASRIDHGRP